jgi:hypothetical protein
VLGRAAAIEAEWPGLFFSQEALFLAAFAKVGDAWRSQNVNVCDRKPFIYIPFQGRDFLKN